MVDVFWYSCGHCFALEPDLLKWQARQGRDVELSFLPAVWDEPTRSDAQLFYTIRHLGRDDLHQVIYDEIHVRRNRLKAQNPGETLKLRVRFAQQHGIPAKTFTQAYESAAVRLDVEKARQLSRLWKLTRIPAFVVDEDLETDPARVGVAALGIDRCPVHGLSLRGEVLAMMPVIPPLTTTKRRSLKAREYGGMDPHEIVRGSASVFHGLLHAARSTACVSRAHRH